MSTPSRAAFDRYPLARESVLAVVAMGLFALSTTASFRLTTALRNALPEPGVFGGGPLGHLAFSGLVSGAAVVAVATAVALAYVRVRDLPVPLATPTPADLPVLAVALAAPAAALAATAFVGDLTGVPFTELSGSRSAPDAQVTVPAAITALSLFVGLPVYLLVAHVLVQQTLRSATGGVAAAALTTALIGSIGPTSLINPGPLRAVAGTAMLALAISLPAYAAHRYDRDWLTALCALPLAVFAGGHLVEWVTEVGGAAGVLHTVAAVGMVAVAAYGVERTDSLAPAALAFTAFVVTESALSYAVSTGIVF